MRVNKLKKIMALYLISSLSIFGMTSCGKSNDEGGNGKGKSDGTDGTSENSNGPEDMAGTNTSDATGEGNDLTGDDTAAVSIDADVISAEEIRTAALATMGNTQVNSIYDSAYQKAVENQIEAYKDAKEYSLKYPLFILNPYGTNTTSMYVDLSTKEDSFLEYTVSVDDQRIVDFTRHMYTDDNAAPEDEHEGLVVGLIPGMVNHVTFRTYDDSGTIGDKYVYDIDVPASNTIEEIVLDVDQKQSLEELSDGLFCVFEGRHTDEALTNKKDTTGAGTTGTTGTTKTTKSVGANNTTNTTATNNTTSVPGTTENGNEVGATGVAGNNTTTAAGTTATNNTTGVTNGTGTNNAGGTTNTTGKTRSTDTANSGTLESSDIAGNAGTADMQAGTAGTTDNSVTAGAGKNQSTTNTTGTAKSRSATGTANATTGTANATTGTANATTGTTNATTGTTNTTATAAENTAMATMRNHILFYDNTGVVRGEIPVEESAGATRIEFVDGNLLYQCSDNQFALVDGEGEVNHIYTLNGFTLHHDFDYDEEKDCIIALATNTAKKTTEDSVVLLNLQNNKCAELFNLSDLLKDVQKSAKTTGDQSWIGLNSIQIVDTDNVILSSRELSSIIKVDDIRENPTIAYIIGGPAMWKDTAYADLLLTPTGSFPMHAGQYNVMYLKDDSLDKGQYYLHFFDSNYGNSDVYENFDYVDYTDVGTKDQPANNSFYYRYLVDEDAGTVELTESVAVPYSTIGSTQDVDGNHIIVSTDAGVFGEYNSKGDLIAEYKIREDSGLNLYRVYKYKMDGYWFN